MYDLKLGLRLNEKMFKRSLNLNVFFIATNWKLFMSSIFGILF